MSLCFWPRTRRWWRLLQWCFLTAGMWRCRFVVLSETGKQTTSVNRKRQAMLILSKQTICVISPSDRHHKIYAVIMLSDNNTNMGQQTYSKYNCEYRNILQIILLTGVWTHTSVNGSRMADPPMWLTSDALNIHLHLLPLNSSKDGRQHMFAGQAKLKLKAQSTDWPVLTLWR